MTMIESTIERYIIDSLLKGKKKQIDPDESLISTGVLDSLTLLQLISFIEEQFNFKVDDNEMVPEYFQSIKNIKSFIEGKLQDS